jgi:hypothetical protein
MGYYGYLKLVFNFRVRVGLKALFRHLSEDTARVGMREETPEWNVFRVSFQIQVKGFSELQYLPFATTVGTLQ